MVSLQRNVLEQETIASFEETYKSSYSHGLEAIYALESVDIKSVRPLKNSAANSRKTTKTFDHSNWLVEDPQLEFDLGIGFREWVEPFFSKKADSKIAHIDYEGWVKALLADLPARKKLFVLLSDYRLDSVLNLTPLEMVEIRRLSPEKRKLWKEEALALLKTYPVREKFINLTAPLFEAFIKPWLRHQRWFASESEILERLERLGESFEVAEEALKFFDGIFTFQEILQSFLPTLDEKIYGLNLLVKKQFETVSFLANSYFYKPGVQYGLVELASLIQKEAALHWISFPEGFIKKTLKNLSSLVVFKNEKKSILVQKRN